MAGEELVFWVGAVTFILTTLSFLLLKRGLPKKSSIASINLLVNCITIASYILLISMVATINAPNGELIYHSRWLFYAGSCSLLMYEVSKLFNKDKTATIEIIVTNVLVMITGFFASVTTGLSKWLFFIYSSGAYAYLLYIVNSKVKRSSFNNIIKLFVFVFWSGFPVVWLLSPAGFLVINAFWTAVLYLMLDVITKVIFGYYTTIKSK